MKLPPEVTFRNMTEDGLDKYVRQQIAKLERFFRGIISCRVIVEKRGRHRYGNFYHVRIDLGVPGGELVVKHEPSTRRALREMDAPRVSKSGEAEKLHKEPKIAIRDAFAEMRRRLQDYVRVRRGLVKARAERPQMAKVERLIPEQDCGFLITRDGAEFYFHRNDVLGGHYDRLRIGTQVRFVSEMGEKGPQASTVRIVHPRKQAKKAARVVVARKRPAGKKQAAAS